jgi:hypothetical protein
VPFTFVQTMNCFLVLDLFDGEVFLMRNDVTYLVKGIGKFV